jgi:hypothetical protein
LKIGTTSVGLEVETRAGRVTRTTQFFLFGLSKMKSFVPYIGTNVNVFGDVLLISTFKKGKEIIKEICGHWYYLGVTRFNTSPFCT